MVCIFGLGSHDPFCPCELVTVKDPDVADIVCCDCERRLRCAYQKDHDGCETFEEYMMCRIDAELHYIWDNFPRTCGYGLTEEEFDIVDANLEKICDANMVYG